jgi:hypothetical protein
MSEQLMLLPSSDINKIRIVSVPDDFEEHEAFRHVTGLIAEVEEANPDYTWEDLLEILEDHGFEERSFLMGPEPDK